ncbi:ATP-binding protein [Kitasatospora sp. NPDC052896]|uniref:ATP-binding protein n=1 Tax=Kitasatospora sp. NPDC052896 TaxID=3364061 RepID=UPI0037C77EFD
MTPNVLTRAERPVRLAEASLPYQLQSASVARRLLRDKLADSDLVHLADDAELVLTELVSNAAKTGCLTTMQVSVAQVTNRVGRVVRIAVRDGSRTLPVLVTPGTGDESGRGLILVDRLAVVWGVELDARGKTVWADLSVERV